MRRWLFLYFTVQENSSWFFTLSVIYTLVKRKHVILLSQNKQKAFDLPLCHVILKPIIDKHKAPLFGWSVFTYICMPAPLISMFSILYRYSIIIGPVCYLDKSNEHFAELRPEKRSSTKLWNCSELYICLTLTIWILYLLSSIASSYISPCIESVNISREESL